METSFANGGQLSASNAEVWNSWGTVVKGIKWLGRSDAPLLMNPLPSWHKYSWLAEFVTAIPQYRRNTIETTRLAIAARQHLFEMAEREGIDFNHERRGILHVYRDQASFDQAARVNALLRQGGLDRHAVTPEEIRAIEPALTGAYHGGFFTPSDSTGDIHKFTRGLAAACLRRGARFLSGRDVRDIQADGAGVTILTVSAAEGGGEDGQCYDGVVICAGTASRRFAAMVGDRVNVYPVKGYSITVMLRDAANQAAAPWVSLLDEGAKIVTSRFGADRFRVDIRADRIRPLVGWARRLFPGLDTAETIPWAGLRPMMPNMMPRVGAGRRPGVFYNTGHGHLGWTLSAATAGLVAAEVERSGMIATAGRGRGDGDRRHRLLRPAGLRGAGSGQPGLVLAATGRAVTAVE
jgi:D-amino-acid dehydrogenase